jgi:hypothetical protein
MSLRKLVELLLLVPTVTAFATPREDLGAQSQEVRDAAARELRASFVAPARSRWEPVVAAIKPGDTKEAILDMLRKLKVGQESVFASGQTSTETYRLDDAWLLSCSFQRSGATQTVMEATLHERLRHIWVAPPPDFSGVWTVYFVNGQRSHEINYANGKYSGVFTSFRSDGSKSVVQHYGPRGADGEDTGYFPSGRIMYSGRYKNGSQVGSGLITMRMAQFAQPRSMRNRKERHLTSALQQLQYYAYPNLPEGC